MRRFNSLLALLTVNDLTPGAAHRPLSRALARLVERGDGRGASRGRTVSNVAALCPSPEGALATGRERGMTAGHGVRFLERGVQSALRFNSLLALLTVNDLTPVAVAPTPLPGTRCAR